MSNVIEFTLKSVDKFSKNMKKASDSLAKVTRALKKGVKVATLAATALTAYVAVTNSGIDKSTKFASRIGVGVDQLTKMQFAAQQSGISVEQMNMATQRMTRRVAEAASGMGEAKNALKELGINARSFKNLKLEDQMAELSDAMSKVKDPADQLRLGFKLFDSEGTAMLQMLKGGSAQMKALAKDAEFLGVVIDDVASQRAVDFSDQMGRVSSSIKGVSISISKELSPIMAGMAKTFANALATNRAAIVDFVKSTVTNVFTLVQLFTQFGNGVRRIFTNTDAFRVFVENFIAIVPKIGATAIALGRFIVVGIKNGLDIAAGMFVGFGEWVGTAIAQAVSGDKVTTMTEAFATTLAKGVASAREDMAVEFNRLKDMVVFQAGDIGDNFSEAFGLDIDMAKQKAQSTIEQLVEFASTAGQSVAEVASEVNSTLGLTQSNFDDWLQSMNVTFIDFANGFRDTMSAAIQSVSDGMAQAIVSGESMTQVFRSLGKQVLTQLISLLIKLGVQRAVFAALNIGAVKTESIANASKAVATASANGVASMAGAPFPLNLSAPAFGASMGAAASSAFAAGAAQGQAIGGVAHGGIDYVPQESTFLLNRGERVVKPSQNRDLTQFLAGNNGGGGNKEFNVNISITALDTQGVEEVFQNNQKLLYDTVVSAIEAEGGKL